MRPSMIANLAITYRCDSRCTTCNIWKIQNHQKDELTLGEIDSFFKENREFLKDVESIQITGGEPYLREDLTEIIKKYMKPSQCAPTGYQLTACYQGRYVIQLERCARVR